MVRVAGTGRLLRACGLPALVERQRSLWPNMWEPWLPAEAMSRAPYADLPADSPLRELVPLLHLGHGVDGGAVGAAVRAALLADGLAETKEAELVPGGWQLTAFRGLLAAAGRDYGVTGQDVHLGEDSLRFTDAVLACAPRGHVLDVGCGSGVSSVAAARTASRVTAVDVLATACAATGLTARLNEMDGVVRCEQDDFTQRPPGPGVDTVVANLPGVPVPADVAYPVAGDGGPDGLTLIRALWRWAARTLAFAAEGRLVMRFQALGPAEAPAVLPELREIFGPRADLLVVTDSRVPAAVRNAITAHHAAALNPAVPAEELLSRVAAGTSRHGGSHYHCSTLEVRCDGDGTTRHVATGPALWFDRRYRQTGPYPPDGSDPLAHRYLTALRAMPDEFWSVGGSAAARRTLGRLDDVARALCDGGTTGEVAAGVLGVPASGGALHMAAAGLSVAMVAHVLAEMGVLEIGMAA